MMSFKGLADPTLVQGGVYIDIMYLMKISLIYYLILALLLTSTVFSLTLEAVLS